MKAKILPALKLTAVFLFVSLLHVHMVVTSGGWLFSGYAYYGRGFPVPLLQWDIDSYYTLLGNEGFVVSSSNQVLSERIAFTEILLSSDTGVAFDVTSSLIGLMVNSIFWFLVSAILIHTWQTLRNKFATLLIQKVSIIAVFIAVSTWLLPTTDVGQNIVIARGAPYAFAKRAHLYGGNYSEWYYFEPFLFIINILIIWELLMLSSIFGAKIANKIKQKT